MAATPRSPYAADTLGITVATCYGMSQTNGVERVITEYVVSNRVLGATRVFAVKGGDVGRARRAAYRWADKSDLAYGAVCCSVSFRCGEVVACSVS